MRRTLSNLCTSCCRAHRCQAGMHHRHQKQCAPHNAAVRSGRLGSNKRRHHTYHQNRLGPQKHAFAASTGLLAAPCSPAQLQATPRDYNLTASHYTLPFTTNIFHDYSSYIVFLRLCHFLRHSLPQLPRESRSSHGHPTSCLPRPTASTSLCAATTHAAGPAPAPPQHPHLIHTCRCCYPRCCFRSRSPHGDIAICSRS